MIEAMADLGIFLALLTVTAICAWVAVRSPEKRTGAIAFALITGVGGNALFLALTVTGQAVLARINGEHPLQPAPVATTPVGDGGPNVIVQYRDSPVYVTNSNSESKARHAPGESQLPLDPTLNSPKPPAVSDSFVAPDAFRPPEIHPNFLPQSYAEFPRSTKDWIQTRGSWVYYRFGYYYGNAPSEHVQCSNDIRAVGKWGWDWSYGLEVVCLDDQWLAFDLGTLYREHRLSLGECAETINIRSRPPKEHWGQHGAPPQAPGLDSVEFISFRLNSLEQGGRLEVCQRH
jgi:hypothetical protein